MVTFTPSSEGVVQEDMTLQIIKVYSQVDPERVVNMIGNGNISIDFKHITPADILASMNYFFNLQKVLVQLMILTTWVTGGFVQLVNYCKTNSESVYPGWNVLFVKECQFKIQLR